MLRALTGSGKDGTLNTDSWRVTWLKLQISMTFASLTMRLVVILLLSPLPPVNGSRAKVCLR